MKILIVEDHSLYRDGVRQLLLQLGEDTLELLEAENADEALELVTYHHNLDMVLLDIRLPDADGFVAMQRIQKVQPTLPIIILSASEDIADMATALDLGAMGYIPKSTSATVILNAIKLVQSGGIYIPPEMLQNLTLIGYDYSITPELTKRQQEVFDLLCKGRSNKEIGKSLCLSLPTVKAHVSAIFKTLNVKNRTQAVASAIRANVSNIEGTDRTKH